MFYAILGAFLDSLWFISRKKATVYDVPRLIFVLWAYCSGFFVIFMLFLFWKLNVSNIDTSIIFLIFLNIIIRFFIWSLNQKVTKNNHISNLIPYKNISKILTIIIWFLYFSDTPLLTFLIAILAVLLIIFFNLDKAKLSIPKHFGTLLFIETLSSIFYFITSLILIKISNITLFFYEYIIGFIFIFTLAFIVWDIKKIPKINKKFYLYRLLASHFGWIWYLLTLFIIWSIWLVKSTLVWFVWLWVTLLFSYFVFWDKPSRKNILLTILVSILIWTWLYIK